MSKLSRRQVIRSVALGTAGVCVAGRAQSARPVLGQGKFRYRVVPDWGILGADTPVKDCHGLARDREGHIILLTNHAANNVIVYDRRGRLVHKWGTQFPRRAWAVACRRGEPRGAVHHLPGHEPRGEGDA
jgi:hypothetical protein